jgi:hypothetical protein
MRGKAEVEDKYLEKFARNILKKTKVRGVSIHKFYNNKWQDDKRKYGTKRPNPAAILRDVLKRGGVYDLPNFDKIEADKILGQLYLYCDEKIDGIVIDKPILKCAEKPKQS